MRNRLFDKIATGISLRRHTSVMRRLGYDFCCRFSYSAYGSNDTIKLLVEACFLANSLDKIINVTNYVWGADVRRQSGGHFILSHLT